MRKMLLALVALLVVAAVGRADDEAIAQRLSAAGVVVALDHSSVNVFLDREHLDIGLSELCELRRPLILALDSSGLTDAQLLQVCDLPMLRNLPLGGCSITDDRLKVVVSRARGIRRLDLRGSPITDAGLPSLASLHHLTVLCLDGTAISDAGLWQLRRLQKLDFLYIRNCPNLTEAGVAQLDKALPGCVIVH
jgi:hypothetical protein